ncbi:unnamed protein product [Hymenolepis diminuta]|uniref:Uncharacterized protein n=1 Tax=Hymenolepis diminuta TaxID=6216 RepID=A0A564YWG7_HYMDI|nr:unnamed protein product [Hymenolepis diminuta]
MISLRSLLATATVIYLALTFSGLNFCLIRKRPFWNERVKSIFFVKRGKRDQYTCEAVVVATLYILLNISVIGLIEYSTEKKTWGVKGTLAFLLLGGFSLFTLIDFVRKKLGWQ